MLAALKALVSRIPLSKVAAYLKWAAQFAAAVAKLTATKAAKVLAFVKSNPGKIVDWFLKGYSIVEIIRMIVG